VVIDANNVPRDSVVEADICIIGAGPAGLALVRSMSGARLKIALLESGNFSFEQETQSLYSGNNVGLPYFPLDACRLRFFGGTANHWGGVCAPFEPIDFEAREGIPHTGWPITKQDLDPYYDEAASFCRLNSYEWDVGQWAEMNEMVTRFSSGPLENTLKKITDSIERNLGAIYREDITGPDNVDTYINANVTGIVSNESGREVEHVDVATLQGNRFELRARHFVLATGGIENPRILLLSTARHARGIGNEYDMVGRYFTEHPRFVAGRFLPREGVDLGFYLAHKVRDVRLRGVLRLSPEFMRDEQLTSVHIRLYPEYDQDYLDALNTKSGRSLIHIAKSIAKARLPDEFSLHLSRVVFDIENLPRFVRTRFLQDHKPMSHVNLSTRIDSAPNPDSRVLLSESDRDAMGQPRANLDWRMTSLDRHSLLRTMDVFAEQIGAGGLGRLQVLVDEHTTDWPEDLGGGFHHMGTTRMSDDPKQGVVDKNCKVHGVSNLHIAGSSVFTTAGSGSPTMTIVALALRLADRLKNRMAA
jgi:choline dehydrogenase-like flavoprotein